MTGERFERRGEAIAARLAAGEAELVARLATELRDLLAAPGSEDPALERLFPTAYDVTEPEAQREWDALTHDELADLRRARVEAVLGSLERGDRGRGEWSGTLSEDEAAAWLGVLNDARIVLGVRIGVVEETNERPPDEDDPRRAPFEVYAYLGWLESELLDAIAPGLLDDAGGST